MDIGRCMTRECKNCKSKTGGIQSKNRFKTRKYRISKNKEKPS